MLRQSVRTGCPACGRRPGRARSPPHPLDRRRGRRSLLGRDVGRAGGRRGRRCSMRTIWWATSISAGRCATTMTVAPARGEPADGVGDRLLRRRIERGRRLVEEHDVDRRHQDARARDTRWQLSDRQSGAVRRQPGVEAVGQGRVPRPRCPASRSAAHTRSVVASGSRSVTASRDRRRGRQVGGRRAGPAAAARRSGRATRRGRASPIADEPPAGLGATAGPEVGSTKPEERGEQRRLAAARAADDRGDRARLGSERHAGQRRAPSRPG